MGGHTGIKGAIKAPDESRQPQNRPPRSAVMSQSDTLPLMFVVNGISHSSSFPLRSVEKIGIAAAQNRRQDFKTTVNRLLYAGWIPHFRVVRLGCLSLGSGVEACRPHKQHRGLPERSPGLRLCATVICSASALSAPFEVAIAPLSERLGIKDRGDHLPDRPEERRHLPRDRGDRHGFELSTAMSFR